ncbi:MAG TPA: cardiolipin synthase [Lactovum miscens]|uniref:cardiolipin synthase n=1 Tax=Lactovum miscens TaxID=190387 RepID=UPI002ED95E85
MRINFSAPLEVVVYETIIVAINIILSCVIIFRERKNTTSTWSWLFVVNVFPIFGFILYLLVGRGISHRKIFKLRDELRPSYKKELAVTEELLDEPRLLARITENYGIGQLIHMLFVEEKAVISTNTGIDLYVDGREKFNHLIEDMKQAKHHIHMEYYIFRFDNLGKEIYQELLAASKRGVEIRLLIDAWGSHESSKKDFKELIESGGKVARFFPSFISQLNPRFNYRLHRKIVVVDGLIAYTGGFNVGDEYVTITKKFGYWRDTHLRLTGDIVYSLQDRFVMDWNSQHRDEIKNIDQNYYPPSIQGENVVTQFVTSGPDELKQQVKYSYIKMINAAHNEILIQTPYYIPDQPVHDALKLALMSGVKVKLLIPNKPDHPLVYWATYYYAASLVKYGADVYTYEDGFIHAKSLIIDGSHSSVGSANFDNRSFQLDFEGNMLIYDWAFSQRLRNDFMNDLKKSQQLTIERYAQRSYYIRFKEGIARLISPLL